MFLTYRLFGSLPAKVMQRLLTESQKLQTRLRSIRGPKLRSGQMDRYQRYLFGLWDNAVHADQAGPQWLVNPSVATLIWDSILHRNGKVYSLHACCIMPNYVHMVFTPLLRTSEEYYPLAFIMGSLKGYRRVKQILYLDVKANSGNMKAMIAPCAMKRSVCGSSLMCSRIQ